MPNGRLRPLRRYSPGVIKPGVIHGIYMGEYYYLRFRSIFGFFNVSIMFYAIYGTWEARASSRHTNLARRIDPPTPKKPKHPKTLKIQFSKKLEKMYNITNGSENMILENHDFFSVGVCRFFGVGGSIRLAKLVCLLLARASQVPYMA